MRANPRSVLLWSTLLVATAATACGGRAVHSTDSAPRDAAADSGGADARLPDVEATQIVLGEDRNFALLSDGSVWGWNERWKSGRLSFDPAVHYPALDGVIQLSHSCALKRDGTVGCWLWNDLKPTSTTGVTGVPNLRGARAIVSLPLASIDPNLANLAVVGLAIEHSGAVQSWMAHALWSGNVGQIELLGEVDGLGSANALASVNGYTFLDAYPACTVDDNGTPRCVSISWPTDGGVAFSPLDPGPGPVRLSSGDSGVCFIPETGAPHCWMWVGYPSTNGSSDVRGVAYDATIEFPSDAGAVRTVSVGGSFNACALGEDGRVYGTTANRSGDAGTPVVEDGGPGQLEGATRTVLPVQPIDGVGAATFVTAGSDACCAITPPNMTCWANQGFNAWEPQVIL